MRKAIQHAGLPILVGLLSLGLSAYAWFQVQEAERHAVAEQFDADVTQDITSLQRNLQSCAQFLQGVQTLYALTPEVSSNMFSRFVSAQLPASGCTGSGSVSLAPLVLPEQRDAFTQAQQQAGASGFSIQPGGTRSLYAPVTISVATSGSPVLAAGTDAFASPDWQRVLTQARDSGQTTLSEMLPMPTHSSQTAPGFALVTPLYGAGKPHENGDDRRANLSGWVLVSFNAADWVHAALGAAGPALNLRILTGQEDSDDTRLFNSPPDAALAPPATRTLQLGEQSWNVAFFMPDDYLARHSGNRAMPLALMGICVSLLLMLLSLYLAKSRSRALELSESSTTALQESEERWRFALEGGGDGVWDWNVDTGKVRFSSRCDVVLGVPTKGAASARIHPEDEAPEHAAMQACLEGRSSQYISEHRMLGEDGNWRWIAARGMVLSCSPDGRAQRMIGTVTDITERRTAAEKLNTLGQHDALTGLPNRTLFFNVLQHTLNVAKRNKAILAMMYVDIDRFKGINDNFGQAVGNKLLREVAETLCKTVRDSDVLAHLGGDDFIVLLPALAREEDAMQVAEKIRQALKRDFTIGTRHINITVSVGIVLFPLHARTAESLVNASARAALAAKKAGRDHIQLGPDSTPPPRPAAPEPAPAT